MTKDIEKEQEKKIQSLLKKNDKKIYQLTANQLDDFKRQLKTPGANIDLEKLLEKLILENSELKVMFEHAQAEISKQLKAGGTYVFEIGEGVVDIITNVKVLSDNQLQYKNKTVDIDEPAKVGRFKALFRNIQFRVYFVEPEGEYTYDPRDKTPIEIKKRSEAIIKIKNEMAKSAFIQNILKGLSGLKKWWDYIPWIVFGATISLMLISIVWWLSGYSLTKV